MKSKEDKPHINVDYFEDLTGKIDAPETEGMEEIGSRVRKPAGIQGAVPGGTLQPDRVRRGPCWTRSSSRKSTPSWARPSACPRRWTALSAGWYPGWATGSTPLPAVEEERVVSRSTGRAGTQKLYTYKSLAPEVKGRHMEALLVQLEENPSGELSVHDGEEFIYVLEGTVAMQVGEDRFDLAPGDSVYYLSTHAASDCRQIRAGPKSWRCFTDIDGSQPSSRTLSMTGAFGRCTAVRACVRTRKGACHGQAALATPRKTRSNTATCIGTCSS